MNLKKINYRKNFEEKIVFSPLNENKFAPFDYHYFSDYILSYNYNLNFPIFHGIVQNPAKKQIIFFSTIISKREYF